MVDIAIEILASSIVIRNGYKLRYRIKSWWAHLDVPSEVTKIKMPRLPMIQQYLGLNGRETIVFIEAWEENTLPDKDKKFLGMSTLHIDKQLQNANLNPTVEWLDVQDPIEGIKKGKLLVKVDAKFISSSNKDEDAPEKIAQPRPSYNNVPQPGYHEESNDSPTKHSVSSRKSETSVFSMGSSSVRSFDQGIQTDLSLPVLLPLPDISRYTEALRSYSNSEDNSRYSSKERHMARRSSQSCSEASSVIVDPLQIAERVLLKGVSSRLHDRNDQNSSPTRNSAPPAAFRRNCLMKQHLVEQEGHRSPSQNENQYIKRPDSREYNLESVEDVIDMLRSGINNAFISSPTKSTISAGGDSQTAMETFDIGREANGAAPDFKVKARKSTSSSNSKPPLPTYCRQDRNNNNDEKLEHRNVPNDINSLGRDKRLSEKASYDVGNQHEQNVERLNTNHQTEGTSQQARFREVRYDGEKAKEQATVMLKTKTAQPTSQSVANPPIIRRRIAAAIFND
ncbi:unnamed protein product [Orchesella dallaii]|uniref:Uncharacterized protein n=1 Tax=Orchesella dallaii TaxID=48710 RepID=A0ABP1PRF7_9HEXA